MTNEVGRNDPCPCGSGKKYKKCCGQSNVVAFSNQIVSDEINQYSEVLLDRVVEAHMYHVSDEQMSDNFEAMKEMFKALYRGTIESDTFVQFVEETAPRIKRPMTQQAILNWKSVQPGLYRLLSQGADGLILVENVFTDEQIALSEETFIVDQLEDVPYVLGFAMSWGSYYVMMPVALPISTPYYNHLMKNGMNETQFRSDFIDLIDAYFNEDEPMIPTIDYIDADERELEVLRLLFNNLWGNLEIATEEQERIVGIWLSFYRERRPNFKKPEVMAAILDYFLSIQELYESELPDKTYKELSKQYGVSPSTISDRYDELDDYLFRKLTTTMQQESRASSMTTPSAERRLYELNQQLSEQTFESDEELNQYLDAHINDDYSPKTDKQKAQSLIYDAQETMDEDEIESIVDQALALDPKNIDAHVMKAQLSEFDSETYELLEKAISIGREQIDLQAIYDEEMPWAVIENRPWFRAIEALGDFYNEVEELGHAVAFYNWLIELNPNDNQGIRYRLILCYLAIDHFEGAKNLLTQYDEASMTWSLNWALYYIFINEGKLTPEVNQAILKAYEFNPKLLDFILNEDAMDFEEILNPVYDEIERYFEATDYLWEDYMGLIAEALS